MTIKTKFNVGDEVYIVESEIKKAKVHRINITADSWENGAYRINYEFRCGFSGTFSVTEEKVFKTPEEALKSLKANVNYVVD